MSFALNHSQQISMFDATSNLTDREKRLLEKSWAKYFAEHMRLLCYTTLPKRRKIMDVVILIIDIKRCADITRKLYESSRLEHRRKSPGGCFPCGI